MGMDVYGKAATAEVGTYFRRSVWGWHPLWEYVETAHPDIAALVEHGHDNSGDGLDADDAAELAARLRADVAGGRAANHVVERDASIAAMPQQECDVCSGTGQRPDGLYGVEWKREGCNGCSGAGTRPPFDAWYSLTVEDVADFAEFLAHSGGFEIH